MSEPTEKQIEAGAKAILARCNLGTLRSSAREAARAVLLAAADVSKEEIDTPDKAIAATQSEALWPYHGNRFWR
jgi:hypothetical protein